MHPLEVGVLRSVDVLLPGFRRTHRDSPRRPAQRTASLTMNLRRGARQPPPHPDNVVSPPGSRGGMPESPRRGGVDALPGLERSNYPAPHAEACCDPDRGRVRPVPLVRRGRPHRDLRRHRPRHRADRLPARLPRPADRQQHHHRCRGAGRRRAAAPLRRQPDRQQPGQAHQRRRLPPAWPDRPERHGARGRREARCRPTGWTSCTPSAATTPTRRRPTWRPTSRPRAPSSRSSGSPRPSTTTSCRSGRASAR